MAHGKRYLVGSAVLCVSLSCVALVTGCAGGDTATVRINISLPSREVAFTPGITDRILAFFTFSEALKADPPPAETPPIDTVRVTVSGPGMAAITVDGSPATGYIELEVPSGSARRFEVRAGYSYSIQGEGIGYIWYYGNETVVNLSPGEAKNLQPFMVGMPQNIYAATMDVGGLAIDWSYESTRGLPDSFVIQAAPSPNGPFITLYPGSGEISIEDSTIMFNDLTSTIPAGYYIRLKHVQGSDSGAFSEVIPVYPEPV
jgi:hypothetical protein